MTQDRIAFIHYPHDHENARLDTMPFALNAVEKLSHIANVDLFLWESRSQVYNRIFPDTVRTRFFVEFASHRFVRYTLQFFLSVYTRYQYVYAVGQIGLHIGAILARKSRSPLIYFNDEFPSQWSDTIWRGMELRAAQKADLIVVPEKTRIGPLCQELEISPSGQDKVCVLPNVVKISYPESEIDWHEKYSLSKDTAIFLHAGSIADWAQIPEILSTVPYWPEKTVLLLHSRQRETDIYRNELSHLDIPEKVIWSSEPLPEPELNSLVASSAGCFALYRNIGNNVKYMGYSSGKLMRSLACMTPVIASKGFMFEFIEKYKVGKLVSHPTEIPSSIKDILENQKIYRMNCKEFVEKEANYDNYWDELSEKLTKLHMRR